MGKSKNELFPEDFVMLSEIGKCFSHPARVAIVDFLLKSESCIDIVSQLPLSQSTVSQHLKELKSIGLIKGEIVGPTVCYCIDPIVWNRFGKRMTQLFAKEPIASNCGPGGGCC